MFPFPHLSCVSCVSWALPPPLTFGLRVNMRSLTFALSLQLLAFPLFAADSFIQLPPEQSSKLLRAYERTVGTNLVLEQYVTIVDTTTTNLLSIQTNAPAATDPGVITRNI